MKIKSFLKRVKAALKGTVVGLILWPVLTLATIPFSTYIFSQLGRRWLIPRLIAGVAVGTLAAALVFVLGSVIIPISMAKYDYDKEVKKQLISDKNDTLLEFLNSYRPENDYRALSEDELKQIESLIKSTKDPSVNKTYSDLLSILKGEGAHTPIEMLDYGEIEKPITITQTVSVPNQAPTTHRVLYDADELMDHTISCDDKRQVVYNPLATDHKFNLDDHHQAFYADKNGTQYQYQFAYGTLPEIKEAILKIREILAKQPTASTQMIQQQLSITKSSPKLEHVDEKKVITESKKEEVTEVKPPRMKESFKKTLSMSY